MRYVICHGNLPQDRATFKSSPVKVGFYVQQLGQGLPQSEVVNIIMNSMAPTRPQPQDWCPEAILVPLEPPEVKSLTLALGPNMSRPDIYVLPAPCKLSELVVQMGEDELRMITCTKVVGATGKIETIEVLPGIKMDFLPPAQYQSESLTANMDRVAQLRKARAQSASAAAQYLSKLGEDSAALWQTNVHPIMTEWAIGTLPPITDDPASWVDTVWYATANPSTYMALWNGAPDYPQFGEQARQRLNAIGTLVASWPASAYALARVFFNSDTKFDVLREWACNLDAGSAAGKNVKTFIEKLIPCKKLSDALKPADLESWHRYLQATQALSDTELAGLKYIVSVDEWLKWMADIAAQWVNFHASWSTVLNEYPATIAPVLKGAANAALQSNIKLYDEWLERTVVPSVQVQTGPVYADGMDFAPAPRANTSSQTASQFSAYCPRCQRRAGDKQIDIATAEREVTGIRVCPECTQVVSDYETKVAYECRQCDAILICHSDCARA